VFLSLKEVYFTLLPENKISSNNRSVLGEGGACSKDWPTCCCWGIEVASRHLSSKATLYSSPKRTRLLCGGVTRMEIGN